MKIVKLILIAILFLAGFSVIILTVLFSYRNVEKKDLTDKERSHTTGQYIKLSKGITHYQLAGPDTGQVVILLHGRTVPYYIWDGTYEYLVSKGFKVLRYDMYGRGYSDRPNVVYKKELYQQQLLDLVKQLHLKTPFNIAGVSFGGAVATDFAGKYPQLINKVILISPTNFILKPPTQPRFFKQFDEAIHANERVLRQLRGFKYPNRHTEWISRYRPQMQYKGFRNALMSTLYNYYTDGQESNILLNNAHKPVLLIWGKDDIAIPFNYSDSIRSVLKTDFLPVKNAGHLVNLEYPDMINAKILEFLKK